MQWLKQGRVACAGWIVLGICSVGAAQTSVRPAQSLFAAPADQTAQSSLTGADDRLMPDAEHPVTFPNRDTRRRVSYEEHWQILTRSVEQRVIEYRQFGRGEQQVLVVGPLEGDEPAGVELLERLVERLEGFPRRLEGATVTVVRDPNPDGRLRGSRTNARGVRLDMNFPTRQWRKVPIADRWLSGRTPESEPETRALIELLDDLKPERIVLLEATRREAELRYSPSAEPIARRLARECQLSATVWDTAEAPASLAAYAVGVRGLATLVLRIPAAAGADYNWEQYKRVLLAAVDADATEPAAPKTHRLAALSRGGGAANPLIENEPAASETAQPRGLVLAAKELEFGGVLAPVVMPRRRAPETSPRVSTAPQPRPYTTPTQSPGGRPQRWIVPYRGPAKGVLPNQTVPGVPGTPIPYGAIKRFSVPSTARAEAAPSPPAPKVERLPPVDLNQPAPRQLPQPIPLYPETGD